MESSKKIIVGKIPSRRTSYPMKKDDVLIAVTHGEITNVIRGAGTQTLVRDDDTVWYFVDGSEMPYELSYNGGNIQFNFSFLANAALPTLLIHEKNLVGKDMSTIFTSWAASAAIANMIADFLTDRGIKTEKQLFESNICEELEQKILLSCQEHFIKEWGMFLNAVNITRKRAGTAKNTYDDDPYGYIF